MGSRQSLFENIDGTISPNIGKHLLEYILNEYMPWPVPDINGIDDGWCTEILNIKNGSNYFITRDNQYMDCQSEYKSTSKDIMLKNIIQKLHIHEKTIFYEIRWEITQALNLNSIRTIILYMKHIGALRLTLCYRKEISDMIHIPLEEPLIEDYLNANLYPNPLAINVRFDLFHKIVT